MFIPKINLIGTKTQRVQISAKAGWHISPNTINPGSFPKLNPKLISIMIKIHANFYVIPAYIQTKITQVKNTKM